MAKFKTALLVFWVLLLPTVQAQYQLDEAHLEVTLRMIGHQLLWQDGDSSSRVMPLQKQGDSYQLSFESALGIMPDRLVKLVDSLVQQENIARGYRVEIQECESREVAYSFEMGRPGKTDLVPCRGRELPEACYTLLFTIIEYPLWKPADSAESTVASSQPFDQWPLAVSVALLMLAGALLLYFQKKPAGENDTVIALGTYGFDTRNMQLQLKGENTVLTAKEADLLLLLYQAANSTVERDTILRQVWGDEGDYVGRTLDVFISKLRKKLAADPGLKIVNVRGVGYKLVVNG